MSNEAVTRMQAISASSYRAANGTTLAREYGQTENGNSLGGAWVSRDAAGAFIDYGQYRNDLAGRYGLDLRAIDLTKPVGE